VAPPVRRHYSGSDGYQIAIASRTLSCRVEGISASRTRWRWPAA
jgi:hypothetical protein